MPPRDTFYAGKEILSLRYKKGYNFSSDVLYVKGYLTGKHLVTNTVRVWRRGGVEVSA